MAPVEIAILSVACATVALHIARLLYLAVASRCWNAGQLLGCVLATGRRLFRKDEAQDEVGREVARRFHKRRMSVMRRGTSMLSTLYLVSFLYIILGMLRGNVRVNPLPNSLGILTYLCMLAPSVGPCELSPRQAMVWYSLVMALQSLDSTPFAAAGARFLPAGNLTRVIVAVASVIFMQTRVTTAWLVVYFLASQWGGSPGGAAFADTIGRLNWVVGTGFVTMLMEGRVLGQLREQVQSEMLQERQSAFASLLNTLYDAVVELDSGLRIVGQADQLARFLSRSSGSLEGRPFADLLRDEEDRGLVLTRIPECLGVRRSMAEVMHVRMDTGDGRFLHVEVFCIYYGCSGGHTQYLLGLREFSEVTGAASTGPQGSSMAELPVRDADELPEDVKLTISTSVNGWPILECSSGFRHLIGGVPNRFSLLGLIGEPIGFARWVQRVVNNALGGCEQGEAAAPDSFVVTLCPRFGRPGEQIRATCRVDAVSSTSSGGDSIGDIESNDTDSEMGPPPDVSLVLSNLKREPMLRAKGCSSADSSSSSSGLCDQPQGLRCVGRGTQSQPDQVHTGTLHGPDMGDHWLSL